MPGASRNFSGKIASRLSAVRKHWFGLAFLFFTIAELLIFYGIPVTIEFRIPDQRIEIYGSNSATLHFSTVDRFTPNLCGFFNVSEGEAISILVLDEGAYTNWGNHRNATSLFSREEITFERLNLPLEDGEDYYIIFDNTFSSLNKSVSLDLKIQFTPVIYGVPAASAYRFMPTIPLFFLVFLSVYFSKKEETSLIPKEILYLLLFLASFLGLATLLAPPTSMSEAFSRMEVIVGSVVAVVSIFVSITALRISRESEKNSERMIRTQIVYDDRKRALDKLVSIINDKNYSELTKRYFEFVSSIDWLYIPVEVREEINREIGTLISFYHNSNPSETEYTDEELDTILKEYEEVEADRWEQMNDFERFDLELEAQIDQTTNNIKNRIRSYLSELCEEEHR